MLIVAVGGGLSALIWSELSFTADVKALEADFAAAGGYVAVVEGEAGVDAQVCERLSEHPRVVASGGMRGGREIRTANAPGTRVSRLEVTPGLVRIWDPDANEAPPTPGYLAGAAAAAELGLTTGGFVAPDNGQLAAVTVIDPSRRNQFAARAFLDLVAPIGRLDQCWVEFQPQAFEAGLDWLPAVFTDDRAQARRNVDRGQFATDPAQLLAARPQRWGWVAVGAIATAVITLMALFRRAETAVYRAFGLSMNGVLIAAQIETWILVVGSYLAAVTWTGVAYVLAFGPPGSDQIALALGTSTKAALTTLVLAPVLAAVVGTGAPASLLKDR